jgi:hypothetical protein
MNLQRAESAGQRIGLVVVFPVGVKGLFNPAVHRVVREVEDRLEGVFVTYALTAGGSPDVGDAIAAARFAGCDSAVVMHLDEGVEAVAVDSSSDNLWSIDPEMDGFEGTAEMVVSAFRGLRAQSEMAA